MKVFIALFIFLYSSFSLANCNLHFAMDGVITPATVDLASRAFEEASRKNCESIFISINTPGGVLDATRKLVSLIMNSEVPVLCMVEPAGGHAGSAGAIILQSCHVAGAMKATNIGAATPIMSDGKNISDDLRKKMINGTVSWLDGITEARKRNKDFGKKIVTEAKAVSATEAKAIGAIDILAENRIDFFEQTEKIGEIDLANNKKANFIASRDLLVFEKDTRYSILSVVADPQFSYLIFMGSLALIYFEVTHPGMIAPGVLGAVGLLVSMIVFDKLEVEWGGLLLILLGVAFMIAEIFVPSFGALGIGGLAAFVMGGFFLFDPAKGYEVPSSSILGVGGVLGLAMLGVAYLALQTMKVKKRGGYEGFVGQEVLVRSLNEKDNNKAEALIRGELWKCSSTEPLSVDDKVKVLSVSGLELKVKKINS